MNAEATRAQKAVDVLLYDDAASIRVKQLLLEIKGDVEKSDYAEEFLHRGGLSALLKLVRTTSGSVQGLILQVVRSLSVYVNALDHFNDSPELVDRIYALLSPPEPTAPVNLGVAKATLDLLIVICGKLENGHQLIHNAAKHKVGVDTVAYASFGPLLSSNDLNCVGNTLLLMNLLMAKRKAVDELKGKSLFFKWQQAGLPALLKPLETIEDGSIKKQLSALQKACGFTIPRSWVEAHKYKLQCSDFKRRYEQANEQLFIYQQQQAKYRLMKMEMARLQAALRAVSAVTPGSAALATQHPTKRFSDGGGIALRQLVNPNTEPLELDAAAVQATSDMQQQLMASLLKVPEMAAVAQKMVAPVVVASSSRAAAGMYADPSAHLAPPVDDDDDDLPPPEDDDDDDLPPPDDDDDDAPPIEQASVTTSSPSVGVVAGGAAASPPPGKTLPPPPPQGKSVPPPGGRPAPPTVAPPPPAAPFGEANVAAGAVVSSAPKAPAGAPPPPPPPPPPPGNRAGGPPPPPPPPRRPGAAGPGVGAAADAGKQYYKGRVPEKKMRPLHWDKWALDDSTEKHSVWGRIHDGTVPIAFDEEEFEAMFSQKEVEKKGAAAKPKKPEKVLLVDAKTFQSLSIMMHKLPTIPTIQNALTMMDGSVLEPPMLLAMADTKLLTDDVIKVFRQKEGLKPIEEYEPPEQFVAMTLSIPEFQRRCTCWLFTLEWEENLASAIKTVQRMQTAMSCVLESQYLPYYLGLILSFGNMMNYGNRMKGNAPAISITALGKLDASKDNRGKVSLLQHLLHTVQQRNPDALALHEELKPLLGPLNKMDEVQGVISEAEKSVRVFESDRNKVRAALNEAGMASEDLFLPMMLEFSSKAKADVEKLKVEAQKVHDLHARLNKYLGIPATKPMKPEEIFSELGPFVRRVKETASEAAKERKRMMRKGQKLDTDLQNVLTHLQQEVVG